MADRDPMGILPTQDAPSVTGSAHELPDEVVEGPDERPCMVEVRHEEDLDILDTLKGDEVWARFPGYDEELMMEAFVRGVRVLVVPDGLQDEIGDAFDPEALLFDDGEVLRDQTGTPFYERGDDGWVRLPGAGESTGPDESA